MNFNLKGQGNLFFFKFYPKKFRGTPSPGLLLLPSSPASSSSRLQLCLWKAGAARAERQKVGEWRPQKQEAARRAPGVLRGEVKGGPDRGPETQRAPGFAVPAQVEPWPSPPGLAPAATRTLTLARARGLPPPGGRCEPLGRPLGSAIGTRGSEAAGRRLASLSPHQAPGGPCVPASPRMGRGQKLVLAHRRKTPGSALSLHPRRPPSKTLKTKAPAPALPPRSAPSAPRSVPHRQVSPKV